MTVRVACLREQARGSRSLAPDFEAAGAPVIRLRGVGRLDPRFLPALAAHVAREAPDILHSHLPRADLAAVLVRGRRLRWVSSVHDIYSRSWSGRRVLPLFDRVWRRADGIIAISEAVRSWLVGARRLPAARVHVVRYGIEPGRFATAAADLRAAWSLQDRLVVGTIGRLEPRKGHDILIRAMPAVRRAFPGAVLIIAGHDPWGYAPGLRRLAAGLGLEGCVRLVGFQEDVASLLHALDIFVFASRAEGFGLVLLEAMDAGRSVVASRIAPLSEIVEDEVTGLLVAPEDPAAFAAALIRLGGDPRLQRTLGEEGRARVRRQFTAEQMARATADLYRTLTEPAS